MIKYSKIKRFLEYLNNIVMFFILYFDEIFYQKSTIFERSWQGLFFPDAGGHFRTNPDETGEENTTQN